MKVSNRLLDQGFMRAARDVDLQALECLYEVIDPELGINIVDLGLVYALEVREEVAVVEMTMTTPACPLHTYVSSAVEAAILEAVPDVRSVEITLTFEPPWDPAMMSGRAKQAFGW